jgi:hypothetical protein
VLRGAGHVSLLTVAVVRRPIQRRVRSGNDGGKVCRVCVEACVVVGCRGWGGAVETRLVLRLSLA